MEVDIAAPAPRNSLDIRDSKIPRTGPAQRNRIAPMLPLEEIQLMKRLIALMMVVAATCCLTGSASAKHGWGTGGDSSFAATTIYDLQQNGALSGNSAVTGHPVVGDTLKFAGKIITAIDAKPGSYGLWIEEPLAGPWSGVLVYTGTDNPYAAGFRVGDIVTVTGLYAEFGNVGAELTEINTGQAVAGGGLPFAVNVVKTGHTVPPAPKRLVTGAIRSTDAACAEQWEGVLAVLDSVYIFNNVPFNSILQQIAANVPPACMGAGLDTCRLNPKLIDPTPIWTVAHQYVSLVGIISQERGFYYIAPRDLNNDMQDLGAPAPPNLTRAYVLDAGHVVANFDKEMEKATAEDPTNYDMLHATVVSGSLSLDSLTVTLTVTGMVGGTADSLLVFGVRTNSAHVPMIGTQSRGFRDGITPITQVQTPGAQHDSSGIVNEIVTVQGVVTVGSSTFGGGAVYIADPAGGGAPYTGLETFSPPASVAIGDNVTMAGQVQEFNNKTELGAIIFVTVNSSGNALPPPANVTIAQIDNAHPATAELYEDMYVTTTGTVASDTVVGSGKDWFLRSGADTIKVGRNADGGYNYTPTPFDQVSMCAILDYSAAGFILQPRNHQDMYCGPSGPLGVGGGNLRFALRQSAPNPFSRFTQIHYSIANSGPASLKIYNVTGQLVRTLVDGAGQPGSYSATWDGRSQSGRPVSSGIYYYRLNSGSQSLTRKLVLSR